MLGLSGKIYKIRASFYNDSYHIGRNLRFFLAYFQAMQVIREHNLSAAIFAPGWVLETQGEDNFTSNQDRLWAHLFKSFMNLLYCTLTKDRIAGINL